MTVLSTTEISTVIKTLEVARDIVISSNSAGALVVWDLHDTLQLMKNKEAQAKAETESQGILKNSDQFNASFVYDEIQKWRAEKESALLVHNDTVIAVAMCYINAYTRVLDAHKKKQPAVSEVAA